MTQLNLNLYSWGSIPSKIRFKLGSLEFIKFIIELNPDLNPFLRPTQTDLTCFMTLRASPTETQNNNSVDPVRLAQKLDQVWLPSSGPLNILVP